MTEIDVSVIITTKNEENHIEDCLLSIRNQNYLQKRMEIIVVDNNSTDRTKLIASKYTSRVYNLGPERSAQRNLGIEKSRGKYFLYLDADMILSECVVAECYDKCEKQNLVALYIPEKVIGRGFWIKVRNFERSFYNKTCIDVVRFVEKKAARQLSGFDENLNGPEDWDFNRRIEEVGKTGIINAFISHNEGRFNFFRYAGKKQYYARGFARYIKKWGAEDPIIRKQFGMYYRFIGVYIENGKWRKMIFHPILTLNMLILRLLVGLIFIYSRKFTG